MAAVISDASPRVHLAAIKRFDLLKILYSVVLITKAVWAEVTVAGKGRPGSVEVQEAITSRWMQIKEAGPANLARTELATLDKGEAEALALALDVQADIVLMDELRGRFVARALGLRAVGTLGVLIEAKRQGHIVSFREELDQLTRHSQLQLSDEIKSLALKMAREDD